MSERPPLARGGLAGGLLGFGLATASVAHPHPPEPGPSASFVRAMEHCRTAVAGDYLRALEDHPVLSANGHSSVRGGFGHEIVVEIIGKMHGPLAGVPACIVTARGWLGAEDRVEVLEAAWSVFGEHHTSADASGFDRWFRPWIGAAAWWCPEDGGPLTMAIRADSAGDVTVTVFDDLPEKNACRTAGGD